MVEDAVGDVGGPGERSLRGGGRAAIFAVFGAHDRNSRQGGLCVRRVLGGRAGRGGRAIGCGPSWLACVSLPGSRCVGCGDAATVTRVGTAATVVWSADASLPRKGPGSVAALDREAAHEKRTKTRCA